MPLLTPDVEPLWIARYDYEPGWRLPLHAHDDYFQLILMVSGEGEALLAAERRPFHAGQLLFLPPRFRHGLEAGAIGPVRTLDTKFRLHHPRLRAACRRLEIFHPRVDERVITLLEAIHAEARRHGPHTEDICQNLFAQLLLWLLQAKTLPSPAPLPSPAGPGDEEGLSRRLERFLRENCARDLNQATLSAALNYSYRHLHEVWQREHRESPLQTLWRYRVARAMQLIRYSDYALKRIAELSGFATVHHFTRVFTRLAGLPPARWRERERAGIRQDVVIRPGFINPDLTIQSGAPATLASRQGEPRALRRRGGGGSR
jgi:AraC-like DNA-binding protein